MTRAKRRKHNYFSYFLKISMIFEKSFGIKRLWDLQYGKLA